MDVLSRVHLNGLRAVETAGRLGSIARAAAALGVSVGAVSQQILKTERQLGRAIFVRTARGLEPTAFGRELLAGLGDGFRALAAAVALAEPTPADRLTVSVPPVLAAKWLVQRLPAFASAHPGLDLRIDASTALADLDGADVDVAIRVGRGDWPGVRATRIVDQVIFPICAPGLAARLGAPTDLAGVPAICDHRTLVRWTDWLAAVDLDEDIVTRGPTFSDAALCLEAAAAGAGVMLAWQTLAADALAAGAVVAPFPVAVPTGLAYWFVASRSRPLRPVEAAFRDWLADAFAPLRPDAFAAALAGSVAG
ncbi:LysR substrate-binding domain-containing protein [Oharaeibacter diazotrophicus]|uniref:DNA-binding transcriptional LysR family regulator n=1 Tax=Oharaeibacter diazotrophicus TaxID=1920512 RepID=A0A4R6RJA4_9HYPH|nr:LysR substrate-binding domain-containing protein [Oharaeibacter diazotrophicus]TDP86701.1 DNA-binding transcriptional LysR family regulator [Oharaeibacter diazotrophicus]BBE71357.1 glycine cleavage system transcriptional activator [Pleomorphomonas sp. SM30]GLS78112.1 LysR family transcriptional regulator [Oharaeibacter diazotrophicus]